jgi:DnaJ-class molecular chaperone
MRQLLEKRRKINLNKTLDPEKYGMLLCPLCDGKGFIINPKRKCCPKCGGFGLIKKENGHEGD